MIKKCTVTTVFALTAFWSLSTAAETIQEYEYEKDRIYQVRTGLGITTEIELSPTEKILDFSTGFSDGWELTRRDNVFYLKPKNTDVDTNMMIRTATHSYILELKVVATDWTALEHAKQAGVQYKITFKYPNNTEFNGPVIAPNQLSTVLKKDRSYNFGYEYATALKHSWLVPSNVYDDGQFTYLKMGSMKDTATGNFPAIFARNQKTSEDFVVNTTVENDMLVVHGIYPYLVIRHGKHVVGLRRSIQK